ncbi:hypothetical protein [Bradyrhizobium sp. AS23.2]|uniref:hypothetical protein n=1 Tax=Bradyrhizobium sp. AS23.2 TaxID=1680155 RepID=UPI00095E43A7|nr:hypothetical protein [Bradyrhizobium sp. AS23.2]OKO71420.1 hypothetical protein AC630_32980 [Bradyrhizobium sp. AS23.2]
MLLTFDFVAVFWEANLFRMIAMSVLLLGSVESQALAQDCRQLPEGQARRDCVMKNPAGAAKLQRCEAEGRKMGLSNQYNAGAGGLRPYVMACMKR